MSVQDPQQLKQKDIPYTIYSEFIINKNKIRPYGCGGFFCIMGRPKKYFPNGVGFSVISVSTVKTFIYWGFSTYIYLLYLQTFPWGR